MSRCGTRQRKAYRKKAFKHLGYHCNRCGYIPPEKFRKRFKWLLTIHHIDENPRNNKLENLEILCQFCHRIEHAMIRPHNVQRWMQRHRNMLDACVKEI